MTAAAPAKELADINTPEELKPITKMKPHELIHNYTQPKAYTDGKTFTSSSLALARSRTKTKVWRQKPLSKKAKLKTPR